MSHDAVPAINWRLIDPASDLLFPLDAQQDIHTAPRWDRDVDPPRRAEVARCWNPFGSASEWPHAVELVSEQRPATDLLVSLRVTYPYPHDPLLAEWHLAFHGWTASKTEPFALPGNPALPVVSGQSPLTPVLIEILNSRWLPTVGMPGLPWQTLRHFVLEMDQGRVCHIAAQRWSARRTDEDGNQAAAHQALPEAMTKVSERR